MQMTSGRTSSKKARANLALLTGAVLLATSLASASAMAQKLDKVVFGTNWYAQAEHGGFYQAKAIGIYEKHGLDVSIEMGGPQVNGLQLLVSGRRDMIMGYPMANVKAVEEGLPVVTVAATFQSDPQALLAHPDVTSFEQIKERNLDVYIASNAHTSFWPWLKAEYGYTDSMARPYTFSVAPFLANTSVVQQGYISSEPFAMEKGGVQPTILLMADYGYPPYAQTIDTTTRLVRENPDLIKRFVQATLEGWVSYMNDPAPGNALIKQDNPQMTDEQIAFGIEKIKEYGLVFGGDAETGGVGIMTDARWEALRDFMVKAELASPDTDIKKVYSLDFLPEEPLLLQ
jgi:NitT/TauT family transport system substrate-binding protein